MTARGQGTDESLSTGKAGAIEDILAILPHRSPFLMVDRITERLPGFSCLAVKRISAGDPMVGSDPVRGQLGLNPFFLVEGMSQTAALAAVVGAGAPGGRPAPGFLAAIRDFQVQRVPEPGDTLIIRADVVGRYGRMIKIAGMVSIGEERIASAELTLTIPETR